MLDTLKKITMSCRKVFTKVTLNLIQGLPPELWPFRNSNNGGGRFRIKYGMTPVYNNHTKSGSSRLETCRDDNFLLNSTVRGFTLIELLVVVLIIGILASVALPQYQKAVWKSRNVQLKSVVKTIREVQNVYHMEHGQYAGNFSDLDVDLPLEAVTTTPSNEPICNMAVRGEDAVRKGRNFQVVLNSTGLESSMGVAAVWTEGPYKCAGFLYTNANGLSCLEKGSELSSGDFCAKIERGSFRSESGGWRYYNLP